MGEQLMITNYGSFIGKKSERLVIKENGKVISEHPFHDIDHVMVDSMGVSLSTDAIWECMQHGISISLMTSHGEPYAKLMPPTLNGTVLTRREQLYAFRDSRGIELVKAFISGKLANQINTIRYFAKYRKTASPDEFALLNEFTVAMEGAAQQLKTVKGSSIDEVRGSIMAIEGRVGSLYWDSVKILVAPRLAFPGREHRGASDPLNCVLNYGYGILANQVETALTLAGLDPFGGFLHVDRPGKKSLVYDFMEEFRQAVIDRPLIAMLNKGTEIKLSEGMLEMDTRRMLSAKVKERLESTERYHAKKQRLQTIIQAQARRIATSLRGEAKYKPFVCGW